MSLLKELNRSQAEKIDKIKTTFSKLQQVEDSFWELFSSLSRNKPLLDGYYVKFIKKVKANNLFLLGIFNFRIYVKLNLYHQLQEDYGVIKSYLFQNKAKVKLSAIKVKDKFIYLKDIPSDYQVKISDELSADLFLLDIFENLITKGLVEKINEN